MSSNYNSESKFSSKTKAIEVIRKEIEVLEQRSVISALSHRYTARFWSNFHFWFGLPNSVLAAISGVSALSNFDNSKIIAGYLAIIVSSLTAINTFIDPSKRSLNHQIASSKYNQFRDKARNNILFIAIEENDDLVDLTTGERLSTQVVANELKALLNELQKIHSESPILPSWAINKAQKRMQDEGNMDLSRLKQVMDAAISMIKL